jgi:hypothetical protein
LSGSFFGFFYRAPTSEAELGGEVEHPELVSGQKRKIKEAGCYFFSYCHLSFLSFLTDKKRRKIFKRNRYEETPYLF